VGDAAKGLADAGTRIERVYSTTDRHHNQIEPHATLASWDENGTLTLFDSTQHIFGTKELVAIVLGIPPDKINVSAEFLGGGYGGKAYVWPHTLLAALAAKVLAQPVRIQLTRAQMYSMAGHQPATIQRIALGADGSGKLTGIHHESISPTSVFDNYIEYAANVTRSLWSAQGGISTGHKIVHVNRNTPTAMRSPHEALGHVALECAMDELAYTAGIDPVELRLLNDTNVDPHSGRPFSTRGMRQCLIEGAERFGWHDRTPEPRSMRDGRYLIGQGVAGAIYTHWRWPAKARVTINRDGSALVEAGMHDLGTGTYTVMRQVAAEALGLPVEKVTVRLGDTRLPESHAAIGSATMANAGAAVLLAAKAAREKATHTSEVVVAEASYDPVEEANGPKAIFSFAAVYAEVRVDEELGLVRLNRFVGAYDAGRIINPKLARSQAIGGIIWGTGQALMEQSETDPNMGRFLHRNLSGYLVPTNADIPDLDVLFVGEFDAEASPLGAKGLGELTAVSVAPAIANAVYHATGKRIRDLPITIEKLITDGQTQ
jgi:xanthine dehydrogenase YagR molybdenum-binding subunit